MTAAGGFEATMAHAAELVGRHIGLRAEQGRRLRRSICEEADSRGERPEDYVARLGHDGGALQALLDRVTVQETSFFRHPEQFGLLADRLLPELPRPVRLWSAGCANGQEPYSLAMILVERGIEGDVVATDISSRALARTTTARYSPREIGGLSPERRSRHLVPTPVGWQVAESVRTRVRVLRHNLTDPLPDVVRSSHVVFCRNVLIYFSPEHARAFLDRLADQLWPGVYLVLGAAESVWSVTDRFEAVRIGGSFVHRRKDRDRDRERDRGRADRAGRGAAATVPASGSRAAGRPGPGGELRGSSAKAAEGLRAAPRPADGPTRRQNRLVAAAPGPERERPLERRARLPAEAGGARYDAGPTPAGLARAGQAALDAGDPATAVADFRRWAYLRPDDGLAHLHLGLALEAAGAPAAAARAYAAARSALSRNAGASGDDALGGYKLDEYLRLLDHKQERT